MIAACSGPQAPKSGDVGKRWQDHFAKGETGPGLCAATTIDKTCRADTDCAIVEDILDECRTTAHVGINATAARSWKTSDPCEHKSCPRCFVRHQFAEDCARIEGAPVVECVSGRCLTRVPDKWLQRVGHH